jgi:hypothetical protein
MQVITSGGKPVEALWSVIVLLNNFMIPSGMILSIKKHEHNE